MERGQGIARGSCRRIGAEGGPGSRVIRRHPNLKGTSDNSPLRKLSARMRRQELREAGAWQRSRVRSRGDSGGRLNHTIGKVKMRAKMTNFLMSAMHGVSAGRQ